MVGVKRFELPTLCSQSRCATKLRYTPQYARLTTFTIYNKNALLSMIFALDFEKFLTEILQKICFYTNLAILFIPIAFMLTKEAI